MRDFVLFRLSMFSVVVLSIVIPAKSRAVEGAASIPRSPSNIVIGFVGGFVSHNNSHHGPVQLAGRIRSSFSKDTYVQVFENRRRKQAFQTIVHLLDTDHDGSLSPEEKSRARIILFGHSWGASAAVLLARDLRHEGVPVLLTVQVDSVAKLWQNDSVIPDNVSDAVNFYQPHGLLHGRRQITAADPATTHILGNYLVDYRKNPVQCSGASWVERVFTPSHVESECDPGLWSHVEELVRQRLSPDVNSLISAGVSPASQHQP